VVGGINENGCAAKEIERYDPICNTWSIMENATEDRYHHTIVTVCLIDIH